MPYYSQESLYAKLASLGFHSVRGYLASNPRGGYSTMSKALGTVPPILLIREHLREASAYGALTSGLRESIIRTMCDKMPNGWTAKGREWPAVRMLSGWSAEMKGTCSLAEESARIDAAVEYLLDNAPLGWLPLNTDDDLLTKAVP